MMRFENADSSEQQELFQVTAMVDVVFILLAFFVLSVRFQPQERDLTAAHGNARPAAGAQAADLPSQVIVRLTPRDGAVAITVGDATLPPDGYDHLTAMLNEINLPDVPVLIAAHPALSVQQVASAVDAVVRSPMDQVALARLETADGP